MNQSRLGSFIEAVCNTAIGFLISVASLTVIFPLVGVHVPLSTNFKLAVYFTAISVARSYMLRRWFNARLHRASAAFARRLA